MTRDTQPAIRGELRDAIDCEEQLETIQDDTVFHRGLGRSGKVVERVHQECPACGSSRMIRARSVNPEQPDTVEVWCLEPVCKHFVGDELAYATQPHPDYAPNHPSVWSHTAICPDCEQRRTVTMLSKHANRSRAEFEEAYRWNALDLDSADQRVPELLCDDCANEQRATATNGN